MITITVKKRNGNYLEFVSKGHAGYAEEGQDIVCAAVLGLTEIEHSYNNRYLTVKVKEV